MNETIRTTLIYVSVALVSSVAGYFSLPRTGTEQLTTDADLFPDFKDPADAASLEIAKFDEKLGVYEAFKVAKRDGQWIMPSHEDYPADAEKQLRDAALALVDVKSVGVASEYEGDYELFGVKEPSDKCKPGDQGIGMMVTIRDAKQNELAQVIIGKEAKAKGGKDLRFVRNPRQKFVFVASIPVEPLKTKFEDWIEKDLLKVAGFDIAKVTLKDYTAVLQQSVQGLNVGYQPRMDAVLAFDDAGSKWKLDDLTIYGKSGAATKSTMGDQEELNEQKLNDLKFAVDDLKIVGIKKKPAGLGASLVADEGILNDRESVSSLVTLGFIPLKRAKDSPPEILASNGEALITLKDGVEYVLRFGNIAEAEKATEDAKLNRYLFVTTRISDTQLPKPVLEPEPAGPASAPEKPADEKKADEKKDGDKPAEEDDAKRAEREKVKKENQRKVDEYNEKHKKATAKVAELNARFANWYYVVAEDTYKKIHLGRNDIIKESSKAKEEGFGIDAFRDLEKQGVKGTPAQPSRPPGLPGGGFPGGGFPGGGFPDGN